MMRRLHPGAFRALLLLLPLLALAGPAAAQQQTATPESLSDKLSRWESEAREIERRLEFEEPTLDEITSMRAMLERQLAEFPGARSEVQSVLQPLKDQRAALGEPPEDPATVAPQIATERKRLDEEIAHVEARLKQIDQAAARAQGLVTRLTEMRRTLFTDRLMTRGPSLFDAGMIDTALAALARKAGVVWLETRSRFEAMEPTPGRLAGLAVATALVVGAVLLLRRLRNLILKRLYTSVTAETPRSRRVAVGAGITLARLTLPALALAIAMGALLASGLFGGQGTMLLTGIAKGFAIVIGAYALGGAFFAPHSPLLRLSIVGDMDAHCAHRWLIVLAGVVGIDRALVQQGQQMGLALEGLALLNTVILVLGGVVFWKFLRHIRVPRPRTVVRAPDAAIEEEESEEEPETGTSFGRTSVHTLRLVGWISAVAAPVLSLAGYYVAARYAFFPVLFSGAVIGVCVLLYHLVRTLVDQLASVEHDRETDAAPDRLRLIPIAVGFLLFCAALPVLALIWGADVTDLGVIWRYVAAGFTLGDVQIAPLDFMVFALVLVIGLVINRRVRLILRRNVLPYTGLDQGGRDAVAAGAGYVGIIIVALVAISSAGIDLSNLAIVAGALSVGIGFGLQNIVNNFVSGIILLVERPIKAGDWIELPSGMGYVKTINVRSTEVETFDRSSLFVPNSALIAENVINWTHSNLHGRIIVPVIVAHGTDPRQVERILLEIARAHPLMLRRPAPFVLLRGFSPDALNFEIRGILRDVNWIMNVHSDINFEILRRFVEEGIEIPFSQTDIHLRNAGELAGIFAGGTETGHTDPPGPRGPASAGEGASPPRRRATPSRHTRATAAPATRADAPRGRTGPR